MTTEEYEKVTEVYRRRNIARRLEFLTRPETIDYEDCSNDDYLRDNFEVPSCDITIDRGMQAEDIGAPGYVGKRVPLSEGAYTAMRAHYFLAPEIPETC